MMLLGGTKYDKVDNVDKKHLKFPDINNSLNTFDAHNCTSFL